MSEIKCMHLYNISEWTDTIWSVRGGLQPYIVLYVIYDMGRTFSWTQGQATIVLCPHYKYTLLAGILFRGCTAFMIYDWYITLPEMQTKVTILGDAVLEIMHTLLHIQPIKLA